MNAAEGFDAYGDLWIHGVGARTASDGWTCTSSGRIPGGFRWGRLSHVRERQQRNKYARLKNKAFKSLHKHVEGDFEPFLKDDRLQISEELKDHVRELNYLDERLHTRRRFGFSTSGGEGGTSSPRKPSPPKLTR